MAALAAEKRNEEGEEDEEGESGSSELETTRPQTNTPIKHTKDILLTLKLILQTLLHS